MFQKLLVRQVREALPDLPFYYEKAPRDCNVYPRADFSVDFTGANGTLTVNIWCNAESEAMPEDLAPQFIELIHGTVYSVNSEQLIGNNERPVESFACFYREHTPFPFERDPNRGNDSVPEMFGAVLRFDVVGLLRSECAPIRGLNAWTKRRAPEALVIHYDEFPGTGGEAAQNSPWLQGGRWIHWGIEKIHTDDVQSYAVTWYTGDFRAIGFNVDMRELMEWMQLHGEVLMEDRSPVLVREVVIHEGSIALIGKYGVDEAARKEYHGGVLWNVHGLDEQLLIDN